MNPQFPQTEGSLMRSAACSAWAFGARDSGPQPPRKRGTEKDLSGNCAWVPFVREILLKTILRRTRIRYFWRSRLELGRNGNPTSIAESLRRYFQSRCGLLALVFGEIHHPDNAP